MTTLELVTLAIAVGGLLLGVRAAWRDYRRDKLLVRIVPKVAYPVGPMPDVRPRFAFEIINDSVFPITVDSVGFLLKGTKMRAALTPPLVIDGGAWPRRLESLSSVTVYSAPPEELDVDLSKIRCAYVATPNGQVFRGNSSALKRVIGRGSIPPYSRKLARGGMPGMITDAELDEVVS